MEKWMHSDPRRQRHGAAPAAVARFGAGVGLMEKNRFFQTAKMGNPGEIPGDFMEYMEFEWKLMGFLEFPNKKLRKMM